MFTKEQIEKAVKQANQEQKAIMDEYRMNNYIQQKLEPISENLHALVSAAMMGVTMEGGQVTDSLVETIGKHQMKLIEEIEQALKDTAREVLDKTLKEDANLFCLLLHPHLPEKKYEELKRFFESQQDLRRLSFQDMVTKLNNL